MLKLAASNLMNLFFIIIMIIIMIILMLCIYKDNYIAN